MALGRASSHKNLFSYYETRFSHSESCQSNLIGTVQLKLLWGSLSLVKTEDVVPEGSMDGRSGTLCVMAIFHMEVVDLAPGM